MAAIRSFIGTHDQNWEDEQLWTHRDLEVTMILDGSGRFQLENTEESVEAGHVVLIPSHVAHSFHAVTPIRFGVLLMDQVPDDVQGLFDSMIVDHKPRIIALSRLDRDHYERLFREWLRIRSTKLKSPERNYKAWMEILLLFLQEHCYDGHQALSISSIGDYIREHLQQSIPVSELAEMAGLTVEGFRKKFLKVYGMTPKHYQQRCRLSEAKWLLSSSDKDIQSISSLVGFEQLHSFSLWFKKMEGCPPSEWRTRQRLYHD
ncbi:helix-turn-helix domain-containing protein [Paenibacillus sp. 1001270B_150601_E10]|uniref:helix-turn-helix domain-containing protein n=1 Tax=Paenibacillus sp. 1001270B_150601_E10 TaxID=2787079 RepID=UPI00189F1127|nr:AraC family transcriptional regulator [Paenibacillus sp. 1001270B_150601_E10]